MCCVQVQPSTTSTEHISLIANSEIKLFRGGQIEIKFGRGGQWVSNGMLQVTQNILNTND